MTGAVAEVGTSWVSRTTGSISQVHILVFCWTERISLEEAKPMEWEEEVRRQQDISAWNFSVCKVIVRPESCHSLKIFFTKMELSLAKYFLQLN